MSTALAHRPIPQSDWAIMKEQASLLRKTGFLPQHIKTDEQALAIMMKARELDVPATYGLSNIAVIQGKPVANSELMLALIYRDHGDDAIHFTTSDDKECVVTYKRRTAKEYSTFSFSMDDARKAALDKSPTWQKYPKAMLRARCISAVARMAFPDSIAGMYTPEELGGEAHVTADDEVIWQEVVDTPDTQPVQPAQIVDTTTGEILDPWDKPDAQPVPAKMSDEALEQMSQAIRDTETPEQTADLYELYLDDGDMHEDNAEFLKVETQVRFYEFLTAATSKAELDTIGKALKQTGIGTDGLRKEFAKAKARIMEPQESEAVTA